MSVEIQEHLEKLRMALTAAVENVVMHPLGFGEKQDLENVAQICSELSRCAGRLEGRWEPAERDRCADLLWKVRECNGRFRYLLESGLQFFARCFAIEGGPVTSSPGDQSYTLHGEWCTEETGPHVMVDC